jgi:hypothetical protein
MSILHSLHRIRNLAPMRLCLLSIFVSAVVLAQTAPPNEGDAVRVNVTVNPDGSRTTYQFDNANHTATAITTDSGGNKIGKTVYRIDDQGRFGSGVSFDGKGRFRFKSLYKYDGAGRIAEETQLSKTDAVVNTIVYSYDVNGRQTGYSVFDASGKLLGQTSATPIPAAKKR